MHQDRIQIGTGPAWRPVRTPVRAGTALVPVLSACLIAVGIGVFGHSVVAPASAAVDRPEVAFSSVRPSGAPRATPTPASAAQSSMALGTTVPQTIEDRPRVVVDDPSLEPALVLLGTWTVRYEVGPANGNGVNIDIPLRRLDGQVIRPGATFDFWRAVGEVSRRAGYRRGGMIVGDHVDPQGALAGGICTVSTAVFNAALRAGLDITARTGHRGYLSKYPLGLDAAVAKGTGWAQTLAFRNDSKQSIILRTVSEPGLARVDLYANASLGRIVTLSDPAISDRHRAHDRHVATSKLAVGESRRKAEASDGMAVVVKRVVMDANGRVLHRDTWRSRYRVLNGTVLDGTG
jgi:vancomycin resistance protein YoaR